MSISPANRLQVLIGSVVLLGAVGIVAVFTSLDRSLGEPTTLLALTLAALAAKSFPFVLVRKGEGVEVTLDEAVLAVMFVLLPAGGVMVGAMVSTALSHVVRPRNLSKTVYNHGSQAAAIAGGLFVQHLVAGPSAAEVTTRPLFGAGVGVVVFGVVVTVLVWVVIATSSGTPFREVAAPGLGFDIWTGLIAVAWGLAAVTAVKSSAFALVLCLVPVVMLRQLQHVQRQTHHLETLLQTAISTASAVRRGEVEDVVLDATSDALGGASAVIRTRPPSSDETGSLVSSPEGDRWLVVGDSHRLDPFRLGDQPLLDGLAAITSIALENASFLDHVGRDPVTKLPGGVLFGERVTAIVRETGQPGLAAVLVIKIGRLDVVKQSFGPEAVSKVLVEIGARLDGLRGSAACDVLATSAAGYLGDGEFALVVRGVDERNHALQIAGVVDEVVREPVAVAGVEVAFTVSIGVALSEAGAEGSEAGSAELVRDALAAASRIARVGGERVQIAASGDGESAAERFELEAELRRAIDDDQLVVDYQPVVQVATGRVVGAEALVRWHHPDRGIVPPADFVPLAEETGLIVELDRLVLAAACRQLADWQAAPRDDERFTLSVNVSARQLAEPDLVVFVAELLACTGVDPERLCLEVTESGVMHDVASVAETLRALHRLGLRLAIDDFGTGYSSLLYLRDFPVDALKIDRSFVGGMTTEPGDAAIVAATVRLAHALGLSVVAEGVETQEQLVQLRMLGCDTAQGFLWSESVSPADFAVDWLARGVGEGVAADPAKPSSFAPDHVMSSEDDDDVLSYLTHELRSPLVAVTLFAELLEKLVEGDGGDAATFARSILENAWELSDLLSGLEDARVVELGTMRLQTDSVDVRALTETMVQTMGPQLAPHPITVAPGGPAVVIADAARLRQIVRNLLSNAGKFSSPETPIEVSVTHDGGQVRVAVRDHGTGIPEDRRHELFRRFSRLGRQSKGMGIGLHLSKAIARAHGGDITYEPADGQGSVFTVELPASHPRDPRSCPVPLEFSSR